MSEEKIPTYPRTQSSPRFVNAETEKIAVPDTASYIAERKERADLNAFKRILTRKDGLAPREGDERKSRDGPNAVTICFRAKLPPTCPG